jgi:hypothetical protein
MAETIRQTTHARQGPGDQPRVPLRPGELVHRPQNINARPTTRFIVPYLTAVGELKREAALHRPAPRLAAVCERELASWGDDAHRRCGHAELKQSLLLRPVEILLEQPHVLSGWLSVHRDSYTHDRRSRALERNPMELLDDLYHFLNMDFTPGRAGGKHDLGARSRAPAAGAGFYASLRRAARG